MVTPLVVAAAGTGHEVNKLPGVTMFQVNTPDGGSALATPVIVAVNVIGEPNIDECAAPTTEMEPGFALATWIVTGAELFKL